MNSIVVMRWSLSSIVANYLYNLYPRYIVPGGGIPRDLKNPTKICKVVCTVPT